MTNVQRFYTIFCVVCNVIRQEFRTDAEEVDDDSRTHALEQKPVIKVRSGKNYVQCWTKYHTLSSF